jgi:hypothetical protein
VRNKGQWLLIAVLAALLIVVVWYGVAIWQATPSMPRYGNIILSVATALALIVGCGLTALMYHSRCKGYDRPARTKTKADDEANSL